MAKFLTTPGTSHYLEQLMLNATSQLVLVTPFLQLSQNFIERLRDADDKGIHIVLIYGKSKLKTKEWSLISELQNIDIYFYEDLHAKCYLNDDTLIISSMNLFQFSQVNNREMSILIKRDNDSEVYEDAYEEIQSIINASIIKKSSSKTKGKENEKTRGISLDPNYTDKENFHIPYLHELLEDTYPNVSFSIEKDSLNNTDQIVAKNFPVKGIDIQIDDRIFFILNEQSHPAIWHDRSKQLYEKNPEAKVFLDRNKLKFYWRDRTNLPASEQTLPIKAKAYLNIVSKATEILS